ncbi:MAG: alanyl-tRNA editing protein [Spirochaetes bacterium]|nr:alanyl-tRNA editing protein [Spirochaetota bacterium]
MTETLYYEDPYQTEFDARVVATESAGGGGGGRVWVELDRTCFYPEGGGQPADRGRLDERPVLDVQKQEGRILHLVADRGVGAAPAEGTRGGATLNAGATVHGHLDEAMRRDYMQQHTGQHIISAVMIEVGGYETTSVHQGEEYTTVDFAAADIPSEDLERAEERANAVVGENRPVTTFHAESGKAADLGLRRPPKFEGRIRIVEVEGIDRVACGGVHCLRTGEVGIIKLIGTEKIRGNVRTVWKIGDRALADYRLKTDVCNTLVDAFSAKIPELPERAARLEENLRQAEYDIGRLQKRLATQIAEGLAGQAPSVVTHHFTGEAKELFRAVGEELAERPGITALLTNETDDRLQWIIVAGEGVELDFNRVRTELLPLVDGKGGGKPPIWQGVGNKPAGAEEFAAGFRRLT